jgi:hypothetical protein
MDLYVNVGRGWTLADVVGVAPTGVERTNPIKGMAENINLSRHSSRQFELDNIGLL